MPSAAPSPFTPSPDSKTVAAGPVLGYWWDASAAGIRPILGVAGAAHQGQPILSDGTYSAASICMHASLALLTTRTGALVFANLPAALPGQPIQLAKDTLPQKQIVFSPSCSAALEYSPNTAGAFLITGLTSSQLTSVKITSIQLPPATSAAAVADSGAILAASARSDGSVNIQMLAGSSTNTVTTLSQFGGMTFLPGADSAILADAAKNTIMMTTQAGGNMNLTQIAGSVDGISQPFAVAATSDGRAALIANRTHSSLIRIDLSRQSPPVKVVCNCSPTELESLQGNAVFRLNEPGTGVVWAFDGDGPASRVVFLPAERRTSVAAVTR